MEKASRALLPGVLVAMILAGALRLTNLGAVPVSLYCDEAFNGYEAYCLLQTGHDSHGVWLPLFFDIFGKGWGEPLYIYLTVPAVALFGLTPFAVRFVAAMAGTVLVPITGLMCAALLRGHAGPRTAARAGVAASMLMAISPWPFHLSRVAFQASLLPLALASGFWLAARAVSDPGPDHGCGLPRVRPGLLSAGAALLGLSLYTYTIARLAMPLMVVGFIWLHRTRLSAGRRHWLVAALVLVSLAAPIAAFSLSTKGQQRFSSVALNRREDLIAAGPMEIASAAGANYLSYYSPRFLLTQGDPNPRHSIRGHGMLYPHDVALLALGVAACLLLRGRGSLFLLWWFAAYPVAAALTVDPRHAVRSICGLPALYAIEGLGVAALWSAASTARRRAAARGLVAAMIVVACIPVAGYFRHYFFDYPVYSGPAWQYGLQQAYDFADSVSSGHDSIFITRYEDDPDAQLLFYRAFPPAEYQAHRLERTPYVFDQEGWVRGPGRMKPVFVWKPAEVPPGLALNSHVIRYPDGTDAFVIAW